jgi:hypothetical protein
MKAISLWQPWASAIAVGAKKIETRSWWTSYRGPLAIHAAKLQNDELRDFWTWKVCDPLREAGYARFELLPFGAIVATCHLTECLRSTDIDGLTRQERDFGDFAPGRYGWVLRDVVALKTPIPFRGAQGFFDCPLIGGGSAVSLQPDLGLE